MTHAERLKETAKSEIAAYATALLAGADALDKLASLPHYDDCDKWVKADAPDGYEVVLDETRECTCALAVPARL